MKLQKLFLFLLLLPVLLYGQFGGDAPHGYAPVKFQVVTDTTNIDKSVGRCYAYDDKFFIANGTYLGQMQLASTTFVDTYVNDSDSTGTGPDSYATRTALVDTSSTHWTKILTKMNKADSTGTGADSYASRTALVDTASAHWSDITQNAADIEAIDSTWVSAELDTLYFFDSAKNDTFKIYADGNWLLFTSNGDEFGFDKTIRGQEFEINHGATQIVSHTQYGFDIVTQGQADNQEWIDFEDLTRGSFEVEPDGDVITSGDVTAANLLDKADSTGTGADSYFTRTAGVDTASTLRTAISNKSDYTDNSILNGISALTGYGYVERGKDEVAVGDSVTSTVFQEDYSHGRPVFVNADTAVTVNAESLAVFDISDYESISIVDQFEATDYGDWGAHTMVDGTDLLAMLKKENGGTNYGSVVLWDFTDIAGLSNWSAVDSVSFGKQNNITPQNAEMASVGDYIVAVIRSTDNNDQMEAFTFEIDFTDTSLTVIDSLQVGDFDTGNNSYPKLTQLGEKEYFAFWEGYRVTPPATIHTFKVDSTDGSLSNIDTVTVSEFGPDYAAMTARGNKLAMYGINADSTPFSFMGIFSSGICTDTISIDTLGTYGKAVTDAHFYAEDKVVIGVRTDHYEERLFLVSYSSGDNPVLVDSVYVKTDRDLNSIKEYFGLAPDSTTILDEHIGDTNDREWKALEISEAAWTANTDYLADISDSTSIKLNKADSTGTGADSYATRTALVDTASAHWSAITNLQAQDSTWIEVTADSLVKADHIKANSADGLLLTDDGGNGIFVGDGGNVRIATTGLNDILEVSNTGASAIRITDITASEHTRLIQDDSDGDFRISRLGTGSNDIAIQNDGDIVLADITGNVCIGTTTGDSTLSVDGGGSFTGGLRVDETVHIDATITTNGDFSGFSSTQTAGATLTFGDLLYIDSDGELKEADADAGSTMPALWMAAESGTDGNTFTVIEPNSYVVDTGWSWTAGDTLYVSTTAGAVTNTAPSGAGDIIQVIGYAMSATKIKFLPSPDAIEHE